jgi:hypothetical protein
VPKKLDDCVKAIIKKNKKSKKKYNPWAVCTVVLKKGKNGKSKDKK